MSYLKHLEGHPVAVRPRIGLTKEDGSRMEVYGHGCRTFEQAHAYCKALSPHLFVMNDEVPTEPAPLIQGEL